MRTKHFRNNDVEVHTFWLDANEDLTIKAPIGLDQQAFFEENGSAYAYGVTILLEGEMTISADVLPEITTLRPDHDLWIDGINTMSGNPHTFHAVSDVKFICLSYIDHHLPAASAKVMLGDAGEVPLDTPGWTYVCAGALSIDGAEYPAGSILKIENCGKTGRAVGDTVLATVGL